MRKSSALPPFDRGEGASAPSTLVTIRPGPVLHTWNVDGIETARVPLTKQAALTLIARLADEIR